MVLDDVFALGRFKPVHELRECNANRQAHQAPQWAALPLPSTKPLPYGEDSMTHSRIYSPNGLARRPYLLAPRQGAVGREREGITPAPAAAGP